MVHATTADPLNGGGGAHPCEDSQGTRASGRDPLEDSQGVGATGSPRGVPWLAVARRGSPNPSLLPFPFSGGHPLQYEAWVAGRVAGAAAQAQTVGVACYEYLIPGGGFPFGMPEGSRYCATAAGGGSLPRYDVVTRRSPGCWCAVVSCCASNSGAGCVSWRQPLRSNALGAGGGDGVHTEWWHRGTIPHQARLEPGWVAIHRIT